MISKIYITTNKDIEQRYRICIQQYTEQECNFHGTDAASVETMIIKQKLQYKQSL